MKILAFAASTSSKSINKKLVEYSARVIEGGLIQGASVEVIDLNDYEMPIYNTDREEASGVPEQAQTFFDRIGSADGVLISFAEHNGSYSAAFKNIYDWASRIDMQVYQGKPLVLLATSPGGRGGAGVLAAATTSAPHFGGDVRASMSIPSFYDSFDLEAGEVTDSDVRSELEAALKSFEA